MFRLFILLIFCLTLIHCKNDQEIKIVQKQSAKKQNTKDYIDFQYDKAFAFATVNPMDYYDGNFDKEIDTKKFKDTISRRLNSAQIKDLNDILSGRKKQKTKSVYGVADCFYPRHNIIFIKDKKIINHVTVCFECNQIKSSKSTLASMENLEIFFNSLGLKVFYTPFEHTKYYDSLQLAGKNKFR